MTMLYRLDANAAAIAGEFGCASGADQWQRGYVAPAKFAPIITGGREFIAGPKNAPTKPRLAPRLWGVPPPPNSGDPTRGICNVRNPDSPFWIGNLRNSEFRCLVPATAFMEWGSAHDRDGDRNGQRRSHWIGVSDQEIFAFAGVWKDSDIPSFAILSCPANAALRAIGCERMPVILPAILPTTGAESGSALAKAHETWLFGDWKRARRLLQPYSSSMTRFFEVDQSDD